VLSLPFALAHAGFALGVSGLFLFSLLSIQGIVLMVDCALLVQAKRGTSCHTYPSLVTAIVGPRIGTAVSVVCCLTQLGVCCVMLNFVATSLLAVAPCEVRAHLVVHLATDSVEIVNESACFGLRLLPAKRVFIALVLPIFVGLSWLPSINALAPLAKIANVFMLVYVCPFDALGTLNFVFLLFLSSHNVSLKYICHV
jgi:amino acid permease